MSLSCRPQFLGWLSNLKSRQLLAFQCIPAIFLAIFINLLPDSPRYLGKLTLHFFSGQWLRLTIDISEASVGREEEAYEVLIHVRGGQTPEVEREYAESAFLNNSLSALDPRRTYTLRYAVIESTKHMRKSNPLEAVTILAGLAKGDRHLGRRAWFAVLLQIMTEWTGITAVTVYSDVLFSQAGYKAVRAAGLSGGESFSPRAPAIVIRLMFVSLIFRCELYRLDRDGDFCLDPRPYWSEKGK